MTLLKSHKSILTGILAFFLLVMTPLANCFATECDCTSDTATPPFLAAGADPNLLLIVDNSESMLDMGYVDATRESWECFDDSFDNTETYAGYFTSDQWYRYETIDAFTVPDVADDFTNGFVPFTGTVPTTAQNGGTLYTSDDLKIEMWGNDTDGWNIDLYAKGNLLNWAFASKFDIQKKILTGGKYIAAEEGWVSEARGCADYRFVKEVSLTSGATGYKLTMGILGGDGDTTLIEIFKVSEDGYNNYGDCVTAIEEVLFGTGNPQNAVSNCIDPDNEANNPEKQVLIHSTTDCWKFWKGDLNNWPQHTESLLGFCQDVYEAGLDPRAVPPTNPAYACFGFNDPADNPDGNEQYYIGRCYDPGEGDDCTPVDCANIPTRTGQDPYYRCYDDPDDDPADTYVQYCPKADYNNNDGSCDVAWTTLLDCGAGAADIGWVGGYDGTGVIPAELDTCIYDAMEAYCNGTKSPQVVDPSDLVVDPADSDTSVGEVYQLPAILVSAGAEGGLGDPIAQLNGIIKNDAGADAPEGLLQQYADQIRIGAMAFNSAGTASECDPADFDPYTTYDCDEAGNQDGTYLVSEIGGATTDLISGINDIEANTWTPLAEAMFNAVGYFTQNTTDYLINSDDLDIGGAAAAAPITEYCQANNIVIITDGGSSADLNARVVALAEGIGTDADNTDDNTGCGALYGSTYFDDLTFFAKDYGNLYDSSPYIFTGTPENISTFIVANGTPRAIGTGECSPETLLNNAADNGSDRGLLTASNPDELYDKLDELFQFTLERAASGSAASVIAATRSGEGAVYQAIFWPNMDDPNGDPTVTWVGEVHALMVDSLGQLYEDTDQDSVLDTTTDERVIFYYDSTAKRTRGCYNGTVDIVAGTCTGTAKDLSEVKYLWSTAEWLADISDTNIVLNRSDADYMSNIKKRHIFTWNDLDNNGLVGASETLTFDAATDWSALSTPGRNTIFSDFGVTDETNLEELINWMRGKDDTADATTRDRLVPTPANFTISGSPANITWRLGDVIHSTPTAVGKPAESFHLLYKDSSYAEFYTHYEHRRNVIYFGANDGMLHAVNGGFYDADAKSFCKDLDSDNLCYQNPDMPELGAELWAYVPYNLQPHLKCLTDPDYRHKYYVDLKPRIFDVQIFSDDADHPEGWGTILVGGMRLGGSKLASDGGASDVAADEREFTSSYFILDITNPENKPVLLAELTIKDSSEVYTGYTTNIPAVVPMRPDDGVGDTQWYLVFGNGPSSLDATTESTPTAEKPRLAVFNLNHLTTASPEPFQIEDGLPANAKRGSLEISGSSHGFISDLIVMDFLTGGDLDEDYRGDAIYFGTIEGDWGDTGSGWGGKMYRWVTHADAAPTTPDAWGNAAGAGQPALLIDAGRPITGAAAVGWDGFNYWVYFGTGRFYDADDKSDSSSNGQDLFFGLKEPLDLNEAFTWAEVDFVAATSDLASTVLPGDRNLLRTDQIIVSEGETKAASTIICEDTTDGCLPTVNSVKIGNFEELENFIAGTGFVYNADSDPIGYTGTDGWYMELPEDRERNLGQPTLLGGLTTFTTYQPFDDICLLEGLAYLYGLYFKTGTAWHNPVFDPGSSPNPSDPDAAPSVISMKALGRGLATTPNLHVGKAEGAKAIVQTSTGAIVEIEQPDLPLKTTKSGRASWRND